MKNTIEEVLKEFDEKFADDDNRIILLKTPERLYAHTKELKDFIKDSILKVAEGLVPEELPDISIKGMNTATELMNAERKHERKEGHNSCRNTILKNIEKLKGKV